MATWLRRLYVVAIVLSIIAALAGVVTRIGVERENRTVALVIDYYATRQLAGLSGQPLANILASYRSAGVWGVGLEELTVSQAAREGLLLLLQGQEAGRVLQAMEVGHLALHETSAYVVWQPSTTPQWLHNSLRWHLQTGGRLLVTDGDLQVWEVPAGPEPSGMVEAPITAANVGEQGLGISPEAVLQIKAAGLRVVPRFISTPTITVQKVAFRLEQLSAPIFKDSPVVFVGKYIPGYPDYMPLWVQFFEDQPMPIGLLEFNRQLGDTSLVAAAGQRAIRVHSISTAELAHLEMKVALQRWQRAVRERDIRLLYLHPIPYEHALLADVPSANSPSALWNANVEYVQGVAAAVKDTGFALGSPRPYEPFANGLPALLLITAGVAAAAWMLLSCFFTLPAVGGLLLMGASTLAFALLYLKGYPILARQATALAAAITFPLLGILKAVPIWSNEQTDASKLPGGVLGAYWRCVGISLIGALLVVGALADVRFMIKTSQFAGVKLAHVLPPLIILVAAALAPLPWQYSFGVVSKRLQALGRKPVPVKYLMVAALLGGGALIYVLRTGNNAGLPVIGFEHQAREWLENILVVRPRTKEILFGHPLLVVALDQARRGRAGLARWLCAGAVIGQLSMVNTFSHIHTPLLISMWRTLAGLIIGLALGWFIARPLVQGLLQRTSMRGSDSVK